ncbi:MAG TPA: ABC transporter substrate-binding protein [bacterium]|nr:ABC transporter substrate-binding protein [bacterium]
MGNHHTHDGNCLELGRRKFLTMAAAGAGLVMLPIGQALAARNEIVIGGTLAQSGPLAGATKPFVALANAWAKRVNNAGGIYLKKLGKKLPIRFIFYDDQTSPPQALKLYERLATVDKVDVFIGPFSSFLTNAALQASLTHHIPFFMVEANDEVLFEKPNPWRTTGLAPAKTEYSRTVPLFKDRADLKSVALLGRENLHERQSVEGAAQGFRDLGMQVVYDKLAPANTKDFSSVVLAMKEQNPDVVLVEALPPPWIIGFLKQARELGLNPKEVVAGHVGVPVIKAMGKSGNNIVSFTYYFEGNTPDHKELYAISHAAGVEPWMYPEIGLRYRAFRRIKDALEHAGSLDKEAIREAMWKQKLHLYGEETIEYDKRGYGTDIPYPNEILGGKMVSLWPLDKGRRMHKPKNGMW